MDELCHRCGTPFVIGDFTIQDQERLLRYQGELFCLGCGANLYQDIQRICVRITQN